MSRIEINPAICSGKLVIRGTRIMVRNILGMVAGGYTVDKIVAALDKHLCRCGSHPRILRAVERAAATLRNGSPA